MTRNVLVVTEHGEYTATHIGGGVMEVTGPGGWSSTAKGRDAADAAARQRIAEWRQRYTGGGRITSAGMAWIRDNRDY